MSSAIEAELAALYIMACKAVYIRIILKEMGHKQPPTPIQTDSAMAEAVINGKIQPKTQTNQSNGHALSDSIGAQARRTTRTTGQNITYTYQAITSTCEKNF